MRVLVAFDKFKGSLSARQACDLAARALRSRHRDWQIDLCPLTDGGEGFVDILTAAAGGERLTFKVAGPRDGLVAAAMGFVPTGKILPAARSLLQLPELRPTDRVAVVEMAAASGLDLLPAERRDPWQTTTYGTGQLIRAAAEAGASTTILGVGGSATSDLGLGALAALGFEFRRADGGLVRPPIPSTWDGIAGLEGGLFPALSRICIACDVTNPLLGPRGAAAVYGPQKGLRPEDLARLERAMERMGRMLCQYCGKPFDLADVPGTGAAGGISFGLLAAAQARLVPGFALVSAWLNLPARIAAADIVITGEGRFDSSSLAGKGPGAVAAEARAAGKILHLFAGELKEATVSDDWHLHAITPPGYTFAEAKRAAPELLVRSVQAAF